MVSLQEVQNRADALALTSAVPAADVGRVLKELRDRITRDVIDGDQTFDQLDKRERAAVEAQVAIVVNTPEKVALGIAAKAKLDRAYFDALVANRFSTEVAAMIVAHQGVGFLFND